MTGIIILRVLIKQLVIKVWLNQEILECSLKTILLEERGISNRDM